HVGEALDAGVLVDGDEVLGVARHTIDAAPEHARQRDHALGGHVAAVAQLERALARGDGDGVRDDPDPVLAERPGDERASARPDPVTATRACEPTATSASRTRSTS